MNGPVDVYGRLLKQGDFVVYAPGDRNSALQFGFIDHIDEEHTTGWQGTTRVNYYVVVTKTDENKNVKFKQVWTNNGYVQTDKPQKSGKINYSNRRFIIMP